MASSSDRETSVYIAKLAELTERYDEMVESMKKVAKMNVELTIEERNLLSVGYKNVIGSKRASWSILSSIEQKEESRGKELNGKWIKDYRQKVESELTDICNHIIIVIDEHLSPSCTAGLAILQSKLLMKLDTVNKESYKDSTLILKLIRDNITLWTSDIPEDADDPMIEAAVKARGDGAVAQ